MPSRTISAIPFRLLERCPERSSGKPQRRIAAVEPLQFLAAVCRRAGRGISSTKLGIPIWRSQMALQGRSSVRKFVGVVLALMAAALVLASCGGGGSSGGGEGGAAEAKTLQSSEAKPT